MVNTLKKRGQKFLKKFSKASVQAGIGGREHIRENLLDRVSHIQHVRLLIFEWGVLVIVLIIFAVAQAFWFRSSYAEDAFIDGGSYTEATVGRVNSMNPLFATTSSEKTLSKLMFATLTTVDYSGNTGLGLASSLTADEDGKVWRLKLRDDLQWSDGEAITNDDVLFTVELIQNPAVNSIYSPNLQNVAVTESENAEIVFTLPAAYADFASALEIPVVPKHELEDTPVKTLIEDDFSNAPVTSGAFSFNALQSTTSNDGETVYLSANPYYYMGKPMLSTFAVHTYADKSGVVEALNAGSVTATAELSGTEAEEVTSASFAQQETSIDTGAFIFFNTANGIFKDRDLRAAIRQGINLENLRSKAPETTALDYPFLKSQISLASYPEIPAENFNTATEIAARYLDDNSKHITIATVNSGYLPAVASELKDELTALGFEPDLTLYAESQEFVANVIAKRSYDILVYEVELGADPDPLPYYHSSQAAAAGLNLSNYRNTLVDDLLIGARETMDAELRARKYEAFLEYWVSDVPAIGLYQANLTYIYNKNVRAYSEDVRLVTALDRFSDIGSWASVKGVKNQTP